MSALAQSIPEKRHSRLRINLQDYNESPFEGQNIVRKTVVEVCDPTSPVQIDSGRIMMCFQNLRAKDHKYYFYILSKLERNDIAIKIDMQELRAFAMDRTRQVCQEGIDRLVVHGLIFRVEHRKGCYLVNPAYAWKGNRFDYLDIDSLPLV